MLIKLPLGITQLFDFYQNQNVLPTEIKKRKNCYCSELNKAIWFMKHALILLQ